MEKNPIQSKDRLLLIYKILRETDESTAMTRDDILIELDEEYGISTARGSLTDDLKALHNAGLIKAKFPSKQLGRGVYGRFENNYFEAWEIKLLIDAVSQETFLEFEDVNKIKNTLLNMTSRKEREIACSNLSPSSKHYYSNDGNFKNNLIKILIAIAEKKKINFKYSKLDNFKRRKSDKKPTRKLSPYSIKISKKFMYMIGYAENTGSDTYLKTYRIDHMYNVKILNESQIPQNNTPKGDLTEQVMNFHENNTSNFYGEKPVLVKVKIDKESGADVNVLYDKMGESNVNPVPGEPGTFTIKSRDTSGLYYNLLSLGETITVTGGSHGVMEKYLEHLTATVKKYDIIQN